MLYKTRLYNMNYWILCIIPAGTFFKLSICDSEWINGITFNKRMRMLKILIIKYMMVEFMNKYMVVR